MTRTLTRATALLLSVILSAACYASDLVEGSGGSTPGCNSCGSVCTSGGIVCGPGTSSDAWEALALCACGDGPCNGSCTDDVGEMNFCGTGPATPACSNCIANSCSAQLQECAAN
jgi:hypothetical protein